MTDPWSLPVTDSMAACPEREGWLQPGRHGLHHLVGEVVIEEPGAITSRACFEEDVTVGAVGLLDLGEL
jgi:hypothetical protein